MIFNAGVSCHCNSHRMDTFADPRSKRREGVDYLPFTNTIRTLKMILLQEHWERCQNNFQVRSPANLVRLICNTHAVFYF
jgi:hypothetical protein